MSIQGHISALNSGANALQNAKLRDLKIVDNKGVKTIRYRLYTYVPLFGRIVSFFFGCFCCPKSTIKSSIPDIERFYRKDFSDKLKNALTIEELTNDKANEMLNYYLAIENFASKCLSSKETDKAKGIYKNHEKEIDKALNGNFDESEIKAIEALRDASKISIYSPILENKTVEKIKKIANNLLVYGSQLTAKKIPTSYDGLSLKINELLDRYNSYLINNQIAVDLKAYNEKIVKFNESLKNQKDHCKYYNTEENLKLFDEVKKHQQLCPAIGSFVECSELWQNFHKLLKDSDGKFIAETNKIESAKSSISGLVNFLAGEFLIKLKKDLTFEDVTEAKAEKLVNYHFYIEKLAHKYQQRTLDITTNLANELKAAFSADFDESETKTMQTLQGDGISKDSPILDKKTVEKINKINNNLSVYISFLYKILTLTDARWYLKVGYLHNDYKVIIKRNQNLIDLKSCSDKVAKFNEILKDEKDHCKYYNTSENLNLYEEVKKIEFQFLCPTIETFIKSSETWQLCHKLLNDSTGKVFAETDNLESAVLCIAQMSPEKAASVLLKFPVKNDKDRQLFDNTLKKVQGFVSIIKDDQLKQQVEDFAIEHSAMPNYEIKRIIKLAKENGYEVSSPNELLSKIDSVHEKLCNLDDITVDSLNTPEIKGMQAIVKGLKSTFYNGFTIKFENTIKNIQTYIDLIQYDPYQWTSISAAYHQFSNFIRKDNPLSQIILQKYILLYIEKFPNCEAGIISESIEVLCLSNDTIDLDKLVESEQKHQIIKAALNCFKNFEEGFGLPPSKRVVGWNSFNIKMKEETSKHLSSLVKEIQNHLGVDIDQVILEKLKIIEENFEKKQFNSINELIDIQRTTLSELGNVLLNVPHEKLQTLSLPCFTHFINGINNRPGNHYDNFVCKMHSTCESHELLEKIKFKTFQLQIFKEVENGKYDGITEEFLKGIDFESTVALLSKVLDDEKRNTFWNKFYKKNNWDLIKNINELYQSKKLFSPKESDLMDELVFQAIASENYATENDHGRFEKMFNYKINELISLIKNKKTQSLAEDIIRSKEVIGCLNKLHDRYNMSVSPITICAEIKDEKIRNASIKTILGSKNKLDIVQFNELYKLFKGNKDIYPNVILWMQTVYSAEEIQTFIPWIEEEDLKEKAKALLPAVPK